MDHEDSNPPSTLDFQELIDLNEKTLEESSSTVPLTSANANTAMSAPIDSSSGHPKQNKINYNDSLVGRIGSLVDSAALTDVKFIIGDGKTEIRAHKLILALSSPVFTSMFYSEMESQDVVQIPDCNHHAFDALLQFIYKPDKSLPPMDVDKTLALLYAARKYAVRELEDMCAVDLSSSINPNNIFEILHAANFYSIPTLEAECWEFLQSRPGLVLQCNIDDLDKETLMLIMADDRLSIREIELFEFLFRWAERECQAKMLAETAENKVKIVGELLMLVRFPTMTATEFADSVVPSGILTVDQVAKILTFISSSPDKKDNNTMEFCIKPREPRCKQTDNVKKDAHNNILPMATFVYELDRMDPDNTSSSSPPSTTRRRASRRARRRAARPSWASSPTPLP